MVATNVLWLLPMFSNCLVVVNNALEKMWGYENLLFATACDYMTHSQLLEGLKSESKYKTTERQRVGARSLVHNTLRGRGACWSSAMGLGRVDKLHSLTWACTQPTQGG